MSSVGESTATRKNVPQYSKKGAMPQVSIHNWSFESKQLNNYIQISTVQNRTPKFNSWLIFRPKKYANSLQIYLFSLKWMIIDKKRVDL